jgi:hypothetical protein
MLKKGKDGKLVMMYVAYTTEFSFPDRNLGLYVVDLFVFNLQRKEEAPRRSASVRITHNLQPRYRRDDPILEGPAFTSYTRTFLGALSLACRLGSARIFPYAPT